MFVPITATISGESADARVPELGGDVVAALVAPGAGREDDRLRRPASAPPDGVPPVGPALHQFACALRWNPFVSYGTGMISAIFGNSAASCSNRWTPRSGPCTAS